MKHATYWIVGLLALMYWRQHNGAAVIDGTTRTAEAHPDDGSNPMTDLWGLLNGQGTSSAGFSNILPGPNADGGGQTAQTLNLKPAWDGSLQ